MAIWNPWHGCHKIGEGCANCYTFKGDKKRGVDTNIITKTDMFYAPIELDKNGEYKIKTGKYMFMCFSSDFLIEEADHWRGECFEIIKKRSDLHFHFLTKRIERLKDVIPEDWKDGYDNVTVGVSVSTQKEVDIRIKSLIESPVKHKDIVLQPLIEEVNIEAYLPYVDNVIVGGEYGEGARDFNYDWVLSIRDQCVKHQTNFTFRQCGTHFIKDDKRYKLKYNELTKQAKKANINYKG